VCVDFKVPSTLDGDTRDFSNCVLSLALTQNNLLLSCVLHAPAPLHHHIESEKKLSCRPPAIHPRTPRSLWGAGFLCPIRFPAMSAYDEFIARDSSRVIFFIRKFEAGAPGYLGSSLYIVYLARQVICMCAR